MKDIAPFEPILQGMDLHPFVIARTMRALRRHGAEIVLAMMKKDVRLTVPAAFMLGIPSVVRHANDRPLTGWIYDRALFGMLPRLHVANSEATKRTLLASAPWLDPERMTVIYNGIDAAEIDAAEPVSLGLPEESVVIGFIGRLERRKGLIDLIEAWPLVERAVPTARLVIAGRGPDEAQAKSRLRDGSRVRWLGYQNDVPSVLKSLDIAAIPSHWEGFGLIATEAMAAGVPVVVANASSLPEIVRNRKEGLLVPPGDPEALAAAMIELARDAGLRMTLGSAGKVRVTEKFGLDRMIGDFEKVLEGTLAR
jgi:glycosyltransferase involved in cell wall biosynthesis